MIHIKPFTLETYQITRPLKPITNRQLLADLQRVATQLGTPTVTRQQYTQHGNHYPNLLARRFGTWNKALTAAGLTVKKLYNIPPADLLQNIRQLWAALNHQPTAADLRPPHSRYGIRPYLRTFGTWNNALTQFLRQQSGHEIQTITKPRRHILLPPTTITWRIRHTIMKRDNFRCRACGASPATHPGTILHIDHITPASLGGYAIPTNLQTLCEQCNIGKSNIA